jgi:hypothetical protein
MLFTQEDSMSRTDMVRPFALLGCVVALVVAMTSAAFAAGMFPVTPNFDGTTKQAGSTLSINWTSTLAPGETLELWQTIYGPGNAQASTQLANGLPANGSYVVTIPTEAAGKAVGYRLQTATWSSYGSSIMGGVNGPWQINVPAAPIANTPASSPWSLVLAGVVALALVGGMTLARRRSAA